MFKGRGLILVALSLVLAVGAAYTANRWVAAQVIGEKEFEGTRVVSAAMPIPYGTKVEGRHLKYIEVPDDAAPAGHFSSAEEVEGRVSTVEIARGEILVANRFAKHTSGSTLAALVGENMRALSVRVNDVIGVAGFLLPGNRVDVLASRRVGGQRAVTETILRNIKVLAVDQTATTDKNEPIIVRALTLEMTPQQTEILVKAQTEGTIQITLRNPLEEDVIPEPEPEPAPVRKPVVAKQPVRRDDSTTVTIIRGTQVNSKKTKT